MYFTHSVFHKAQVIYEFVAYNWSHTRKLVFAAVMATLTAILQSAGGYLPAIGFLISPFATLSLFISMVLSIRYGFFSYVLAIVLLILIEPSELFIFPFTTGLLGLGLGFGLKILKQRGLIIIFNGFLLLVGICIPIYILGFPALGPIITSFGIVELWSVLGFSVLYSWLWLEIGLFFLGRIKPMIVSSK